MEKNAYPQKRMEIDINDLMWKILSQWKLIIVVSIIVAAIVTGAKYYKDTQSYKESIEAQKEEQRKAEMTIDERIEGIYNQLSESDRNTVNYYIQQKQWLNEQKDYLSNSILMQMDLTNPRVLKLVYHLHSDDSSYLVTLLYDYNILIHGNKVIEAVKPLIAKDSENVYIGELFFEQESRPISDVTESNGTALWISIVLPEGVDADAIEKAIDDEINRYSSTLQQQYAHNISLAGAEETHAFIRAFADKKTATINNIVSLENTTKTTESLLSETQRAAANEIISIEEENGNDEKSNADNKQNNVMAVAPGINKKYTLLGLMMGIFMYIAAYVALILVKGEITSAISLMGHSRSRLLGEIYYESNASGLKKYLHSRIVDKYHYQAGTGSATQLERLNESLLAICEHTNVTAASLFVAGKNREALDNHTDGIQAVVKTIKNNAAKNGISLDVIDMTERIKEKELLTVKNAVLIVERGSKISKVEQIESICSEYDIRILGTAYIAEK